MRLVDPKHGLSGTSLGTLALGGHPAPLLRPAPDDLLRFWPVSKAVNSPRNNGPELLAEQAARELLIRAGQPVPPLDAGRP